MMVSVAVYWVSLSWPLACLRVSSLMMKLEGSEFTVVGAMADELEEEHGVNLFWYVRGVVGGGEKRKAITVPRRLSPSREKASWTAPQKQVAVTSSSFDIVTDVAVVGGWKISFVSCFFGMQSTSKILRLLRASHMHCAYRLQPYAYQPHAYKPRREHLKGTTKSNYTLSR